LNCEEYEKLLGFGSSTLTGSFPSEVPFERRKKIIIVGAGICGIQQAILLLKDGNKLRDMMVFDALDGFGGVWRKNTYPGCACDVPSMMYSTSWWLNKGRYSYL
jgi:cation diffusion facilitator CzcD-associated flavoprotein CzcO